MKRKASIVGIAADRDYGPPGPGERADTTAAGVYLQPDRVAHGAAWTRFCVEMRGKRYGREETRDAWLWFLSGWLAKAKQQDMLGNAHRRPRNRRVRAAVAGR